ncbi:MAG: hypothetical protein M1840_004556 [Geoglossum simile]|nr:MAG: hypothetical protein M1840_004556 [Geoglossum simile]
MLPASHPIAPGDTTKDLAEYLRTTTPPWYDPSSDPRNKPRSVAHKKTTFGFLRPNASAPIKPHPNPIYLPETVVARTSTNGKRYLHISLPTETSLGHRSQSSLHALCTPEDRDRYHRNEPRDLGSRPGGADTSTTSGAPSVTSQGPGQKPTPSNSPWNTDGLEHPDIDTVDSYHSYLRAQITERSLPKGGARFAGKPRRPASADAASRGTRKNPQFRTRRNTTDNTHDQKNHAADRPFDATADSATPGYSSVFIHSHGLPPRKSSITKTRLFIPNAHITMAHERSSGPNSADRHPSPQQEPYRVKRTSTQSANTVAETIRSDASSSVTTDPESTPSTSNTQNPAFPFNTTTRAPPRPGPAPTRALPSLPEGHDASIGSKDRPANLSKQSATPDKLDVRSEATPPHQTGITGTSDHPQSISPPETLKAPRKSREERVRERKMRDLQSTRVRRELKGPSDTLRQAAHGNEDRQAETRNSQTSTTSSSSTSGSRPRTGRRPSASSSLQGFTVGLPRESDPGLNSCSPIMIVAEQEPMAQSMPPEYHPVKKSESTKRLYSTAPVSYVQSRSPSPSLPSSDDDSARMPRVKKKGSLLSSATTAAAFKAFEAGATPGKEVEIEARLIAVEKKNALLESALLAILQSTTQIPAGLPSTEETLPQGAPPLDALVQSLGVLLGQNPTPSSS